MNVVVILVGLVALMAILSPCWFPVAFAIYWMVKRKPFTWRTAAAVTFTEAMLVAIAFAIGRLAIPSDWP